MILILSFDEYEQCTDPVIDWLLYYKVDFIKLTQQDLYSNSKFKIDIINNTFLFNNIDLVKEVNCIYYRRFEDNLNLNLRNSYPTNQAMFELKYELKDLIKYIYFIFRDKVWFPAPENISIDKLTALSIAKECGLSIPSSIVTNNSDDTANFISTNSSIVKPIRFSGYYTTGDITYNVYTNSIFIEDLRRWHCTQFFPTLIQEKIEKAFEIRTFYLDGDIYASAILVQDEKYDDIKRNFNTEYIKWIPYKFPEEIEYCIRLFMSKVSLNTGSIDMMKTKEGKFVFIEVNPVGQFMAPSDRCNYYIEQKIAKWLIKNDKE